MRPSDASFKAAGRDAVVLAIAGVMRSLNVPAACLYRLGCRRSAVRWRRAMHPVWNVLVECQDARFVHVLRWRDLVERGLGKRLL